MESFKVTLEIIGLLTAFGGLIYYVATVESNIYRTIDTTCDIVGEKISYLEKQLELHILEYKQQILFSRELSQHLHQDTKENFKRIYTMLEENKEMCKEISCLNRNGKDDIRD